MRSQLCLCYATATSHDVLDRRRVCCPAVSRGLIQVSALPSCRPTAPTIRGTANSSRCQHASLHFPYNAGHLSRSGSLSGMVGPAGVNEARKVRDA